MELDDFRDLVKRDEDSFEAVQSDLRDFKRSLRRNFVIESIVAAFSFVVVLAMILGGHIWYPYILSELLPDISSESAPKMNIAMYAALVLMGLYSVIVPIMRYFADCNDNTIGRNVASRIDAEIARMESQKKLWSTAHLWSIGPAVVIGVLFFWGLNTSLSGSWEPSIYLWAYFAFVTLASIGGAWLRNDMISRNVDPLLQRLYGAQRDIQGLTV